MKNICGIIVEYNPLHNGHLHHLKMAKEKTNADLIIAVMSSHFTQRGEPAIIDKFTRTKYALEAGIDLIIELPFVFATQSADYFAKGSVYLLNQLQCSHIVFGSETKAIEKQIDNIKDLFKNYDSFNNKVKELMMEGLNYPEANNIALTNLGYFNLTTPNDLLAFSYMKEIVKNQYPITPISISRTHPYHDQTLKQTVTSASGIRKAILDQKEIINYTPMSKDLKDQLHYLDDYFQILKYKLLTTPKERLASIHLINEGLENKMLQEIKNSTSMVQFIDNVSSKRYTKVRIQRSIVYILMDILKEDIKNIKKPNYIRVLGMSNQGKNYLHYLKEKTNIPIITRFSQIKDPLLDLEFRATALYAISLEEPNRTKLIQKEYKQPVIIHK